MGSSSPETERALPERVALHVVEPSASTGSIAVLLCCADADADVLAEQMERIDVTDVRLVAGLERDTIALRDELAALDRQSLVVVCKTDALGADAVRRAVECFGLRRTWTHRLLVLELTSRHSTSWIGSVHRTLAAMARRRSRPAAIAVASVTGEIHGSAREAATAPPQDEPAVVLGAATSSHPRCDDVGPIPAHVRAPGQRPGHLALVVADADESASESHACLVPPVVSATARPRMRGRLAIPGGLAAILAAAVVGTFLAPRERASSPTSATSPAIHAALGSEDAGPGAMRDVVQPRFEVPPRPAAPAPTAQGEGARVIVVPQSDRLDDALASGRAVRHDGFVVWTEAEPADDWWRAANLCRARARAGLRGWRLPTVGEARALRRAGVLPKVDSWTLSRVVDGEGNWVAGADGRFTARAKHDGSAHAACLRPG